MIGMENICDKLMIFFILGGLILSLIITISHLLGKTHRLYDPWLLPVFVAMILQIVGA